MLEEWKPKRDPQRQLSLNEVMTLNIMRYIIISIYLTLKHLYGLPEAPIKPIFPSCPTMKTSSRQRTGHSHSQYCCCSIY